MKQTGERQIWSFANACFEMDYYRPLAGQGSWMLFDGARALTIGDYVTPSSGPSAGQLGPWSKIVAVVGLEPRSIAVKALHVLLGAAWIVAAVCFAFAVPAGWMMLLICAICSLWYLPIGTVASVVLLGLLFLLRSWTP